MRKLPRCRTFYSFHYAAPSFLIVLLGIRRCAALTAYNALWGNVPVKSGDYVLVQGTGGVSIFGLQFAVTAGAIVIATSSSDEKLKIAEKLGAKHLINYNKTPNWEEEVLKIVGPFFPFCFCYDWVPDVGLWNK